MGESQPQTRFGSRIPPPGAVAPPSANGAAAEGDERSPQWRFLEARRHRIVARVRRVARPRMKRVAKLEARAGEGLPSWVRVILAVVFLTLTSLVDYALFDALLGFPPPFTWTVTVTANLIFLAVCHVALAPLLHDVVHTEDHRWAGRDAIAKASIVAATTLGLLGFSGAAAWARARGVSGGTGILGVWAPSFGVSVAIFGGLLVVFFASALAIAYKDVERERAIESGVVPTLPPRLTRRIVGICEAALQTLQEIADRGNADLERRAAAMKNPPTTVPNVEVPSDLVEFFTNAVERYKGETQNGKAQNGKTQNGKTQNGKTQNGKTQNGGEPTQ